MRESKRSREREFLMQVHETVSAGGNPDPDPNPNPNPNQVHETVSAGGKVLIPVFALGRAQELLISPYISPYLPLSPYIHPYISLYLGRAQELLILLESYWERMSLQVPVYF